VAVVVSSLGGVYACSSDDGVTPGTDAGVDSSTGSDGSNDAPADQSSPPIECEVAIVGGGPGGLHTAYKLTNPPADAGTVTGLTTPSGLCVFEKNDRLGGRVRDVQFGANASDVTGTGAYRMYDNQYTYDLATELGVTVQAPFAFSNLRGLENPGGADAGQLFGYSGDAFKSLYGQTKNDDDMWAELLCGAQVPKDANRFPNYAGIAGGIANKSTVDYVRDVLGAQGAQYFFDQNRFRADFAADVDAIGYLEYGMIDYFGSGGTRYPIPGHSVVIEKMGAAVKAKGGRVYLSEPVKSVASVADGSFTLETSKRSVKAKQVILAVTHGALGSLTGDVITTIKGAKEYGSVTSAKSMQVTHQWDKTWWKGDLRYPNQAKVVGGDLADGSAPILRADTTIMTNGHCINSIEMPFTAHHDGLKVTRSVYSDNRACVDKNLTLLGDGGTGGVQALNDEILKSLRILFPAVFDGTANEPKIVKTDVNVHDEAWYYLKKGSTANGVTNKTLFDWSVTPVAGKKIYLVGDSWYPLGSGWMNAAYISSIRVLNTHFGMTLASRELPPVACPP
jgi:hypothetical protein